MTTNAEIKRMLKPLLERRRDLGYDRRLLVIKPFHHVMSGVLFDHSSGEGCFRPKWFATHFLGPDEDLLWLGWGNQLGYVRPDGWSTLRPDIQELLEAYIEGEALLHARALRRLDPLLDFAANHMHSGRIFADPLHEFTIMVACGNLSGSTILVQQARERLAEWTPPHSADYRAKVATLCDLYEAEDVPGMAKHLQLWEAEAVRKFKCEKFWEPSPFSELLQAQSQFTQFTRGIRS